MSVLHLRATADQSAVLQDFMDRRGGLLDDLQPGLDNRGHRADVGVVTEAPTGNVFGKDYCRELQSTIDTGLVAIAPSQRTYKPAA